MKAILIFTIIILSYDCFAQPKARCNKLTDKISWLDFLNITIWHGVEYYERKEINIIYHHGNSLKIHSILKSNNEKDRQIDTTFLLSGPQIMIIDRFGENFKNNTIKPKGLVLGGTRTIYYVTIHDSTKILDNMSGYSLILDLLNNQAADY